MISLVLHLPFTPLGPLLGMLALFVGARDVPEAPIEELRGIPVEILRDPGTLPETSAVPPPSSNQTVAKILPPPKPAAPVDAGAPKPDLDAGRVADAGPEDAGLDAGRDAGLDAGSDAGICPERVDMHGQVAPFCLYITGDLFVCLDTKRSGKR